MSDTSLRHPARAAVYTAAAVQALLMGVLAVLASAFAIIMFDGCCPLSALATALSTVVLLAVGVHCLGAVLMRRLGEPRPWRTAAVASAAAVTAPALLPVLALSRWDLPDLLSLAVPPVAAVLGVAALHRFRRPVAGALGAVLVCALVAAAPVQVTDEVLSAGERRAAAEQVSGFPLPVAVLDAPNWEVSKVEVDHSHGGSGQVAVTYEPRVPPEGFEEFALTLYTEDASATRFDRPWPPLLAECAERKPSNACVQEDGLLVGIRLEDDESTWGAARLEFAEGAVAELLVWIPEPDPDELFFPDVDLVGLAGHIRAAEPGEAEGAARAWRPPW